MNPQHSSRRAVLPTLALVLGSAAAGGLLTAILAAGPLNPPAGPVTSTYKTLSEVEPRIAISAANTPGDATSSFKITLPGSYYLTGNLQGVAGKHGINVTTGNVSIDLMGFTLQGVAGSFTGIQGPASGVGEIVVTNGIVRDWGGRGIDLGNNNDCSISRILARSNTGDGISAGPNNNVISDCSALFNGGAGFAGGFVTTMNACAAQGNTGVGIVVGAQSVAVACTSVGNGAHGFALGTGSQVSHCSAEQNHANGFNLLDACRIEGCNTRFNQVDGIFCSTNCTVVANNCVGDGNGIPVGAGIHSNGTRSRIEANNCVGADRGIAMDFPDNIIIRNTCSGNTVNWLLVANNYYGPIIDRTGIATAAVNGAAAAGTLASTDPNANFSY